MAPEVLAAMADAAASFVPIDALQARAGEIIADVTGAEAGYVVSGAAAGLSLGVAACVAGMDVAAMDRLPDTSGLKDEVVVQRGHRNAYDHAIRAVGVRMVEVGYLGYPGAGGTQPVADRRGDHRADGGGRLPDPRHPRHGAAARGLPDRARARRSGHRRCRRRAAASRKLAPLHRGRRGSGRLLRRQSDRRAAGQRHPRRPGRPDRLRRAPAPGHGRAPGDLVVAPAARFGSPGRSATPGVRALDEGRAGGDRRAHHGAAPLRRRQRRRGPASAGNDVSTRSSRRWRGFRAFASAAICRNTNRSRRCGSIWRATARRHAPTISSTGCWTVSRRSPSTSRTRSMDGCRSTHRD